MSSFLTKKISRIDCDVRYLTAIICFCIQRSLKEIAELYGSESSLHAVQEYRSSSGLESITAKCFKAAKISAIFIDDGLVLDKMQEIEWHKAFVPIVGRILRIEHLAEKILDEVRNYLISAPEPL